jgi:hypothetical protein
LEHLDNAIAYPIAGCRFGVRGASKAMVAITIQSLAALANVKGDFVNDA